MIPTEKPKRKRPRPLYNFFFICFWATIVVMFTVLIVTQATRYNELRAELYRIEAEVVAERALEADLEMRLLFLDSDAIIERLARERLGMVRQNEIVFVNIADW